ncbi:MAG: U32 family peptidase [Endomicrobiaceae bacterium]|nr:U32 family peptidase [Endomicrobiaceae bacterium]
MTIELLAPAGNYESFFSAVNAGADAVYVGMKDFSARSKARNFSYKELYNICLYAKEKKVKVYVALNTLLQQKDLLRAFECLEQIKSAGADAVIAQDAGLACMAKKYFPELKLHASTQLAVHNSSGVKQAVKMGFSRVVLARELSFDQINVIKNKTTAEIEVFCHGALCFSVSGLCLFSSFIGGYSGNRGFCTQPCRRLWTVNKKQGYFLSPKDLQLSDYIQRLKDIGITSLKIEGRMKNSDYVYKTVKAYRLLIDAAKNDMDKAVCEAENILRFDYARQKTSFNFKGKDENIFEPEKSKNTGLPIGNIYDAKEDSFCVKTDYILKTGDVIRISDGKRDSSIAFEIKRIEKISEGWKIFHEGIYAENGFEIFKTADYNDKAEITGVYEKEPPPVKKTELYIPKFKQKASLPNLFIRINNFKWLKLLGNTKESVILKLTPDNFDGINNIQPAGSHYIELPPFIDQEDTEKYRDKIDFLIKKGFVNFFINNIAHFEFFQNKKVLLYAGQFLYTLNTYAAELFGKFNIRAFTVSWEDDTSNISEIARLLNGGLIVYLSGFPELAVSKMTFYDAVKNQNIKSARDEFKIISSEKQNIILPRYPVTAFGLKSIFLKFKINSFAIDLSYIEPDKNYLDAVLKAFYGSANINSVSKFNLDRKLR